MLLKYRINYLSGVARPTFDLLFLLFFEINAIQRVFLPSPVRRRRIIHQKEMPRFEFRSYFYRNGEFMEEETHPRNKERVINFSAPGQFPLCRGTVESWPSSLPSFLSSLFKRNIPGFCLFRSCIESLATVHSRRPRFCFPYPKALAKIQTVGRIEKIRIFEQLGRIIS